MPKMNMKELDKFMKDNPDASATQAIKEQLREPPATAVGMGSCSKLIAGPAQIRNTASNLVANQKHQRAVQVGPDSTSHKQADGGPVDINRSMSVIERNRGKHDFVLLEHDVVEANTKLIAQLHNDILECMRIGLEKAIQIGKLIFEQKKRIKHGKFTRWAAEFLPFNVRTAQNYMRLYEYKGELLRKNITSLSSAYAALRGEAAPDEVIDADDGVNARETWEIVETSVNLDNNRTLPKKKAKGIVTKLAISQEVIARIREQDYPFQDDRGRYLKIVVSTPNRNVCKSNLIGEFVLEASKLLKPGGKLIFHKK